MTKQEQGQLARVLLQHYPRLMDAERLRALWDSIGNEDAEAVAMAIDAHVRDTSDDGQGRPVGQYPPSAAHIMRHIKRWHDEAAKQEREEQHQTRQRVQDRKAGRRIPLKLPDFVTKQFTHLAGINHTWTSDCHECSDKGLASFFAEYDPRSDRYVPGRVYLRSEAMALPQEQYDRLRRHTAVCDCQAGHVRPERALTVMRWSDKHGCEVEVPTYPKLEHIRTIAGRRQDGDAQTAVRGGNHRSGGDGRGHTVAGADGRDGRRGQDRVGVTGSVRGDTAGGGGAATSRSPETSEVFV